MASIKVYALDNLPDATKTLFLSNMDAMLTDASAGRLVAYRQPKWWELLPEGRLNPTVTIPAPNRVLTFYRLDDTPFVPQPFTAIVTWSLVAVERHGHLFNVFDKAGLETDWYCRAEDLPIP